MFKFTMFLRPNWLERKRQRLTTEIRSLSLVLDVYSLPPKKRSALRRRRLRCIEALARLEQSSASEVDKP